MTGWPRVHAFAYALMELENVWTGMPILFVFSRPVVAFKNMHEMIEAVIVLIFDLTEPSRFIRFKCGALII